MFGIRSLPWPPSVPAGKMIFDQISGIGSNLLL